jgi:predicted Zn-dependent peptidase
MADVARRPNFAQADFDRVMANLKRQLAQTQASPQAMASVLLAKALYPNHPYGDLLPTATQLDQMKLADMQRFHEQQMGAARSTLYVVGQYDRGAVLAAAEKAFGSWKAGPPRKIWLAQASNGPRLILADRPGSQQTTIRLALSAPAVDTPTDIPFRVTDSLLGGAFSSRITTNIREDKGYTYSPGSSVGARRGGATWIWNADITPAVTGKAMAEVFKEIRRLQSQPPAAAETLGMKTYTANYLLIRTTDAGLIASQLVRADLLGIKPSYFSTYVQRAMAVSPAQISALAAQDLKLNRMTVVVVGDMKSVEPQLMALPELKGVPVQHVILATAGS